MGPHRTPGTLTALGGLVGHRGPVSFLEAASALVKGPTMLERSREELASAPDDPMAKQDVARALVWEKAYPEALELFLWCFDHGLEHDSAFTGVRSSFLLDDIARLGKAYPTALEALRERRDRARAFLLDPPPVQEPAPDLDKTDFMEFLEKHRPRQRAAQDLASLNRALGDEELTLDVYDALALDPGGETEPDSRDRASKLRRLDNPRSAMLPAVVPLLLKAKRHHDVLAGHSEPSSWLREGIEYKRKTLERLGTNPRAEEALHANLMRDAGQLYQALVGSRDHDADAAEFQSILVELAPSVATWQLLMEHAHDADRWSVQVELRKAALESLPEHEHGNVPHPRR